MKTFAFVPALALPTTHSRSAYLCGARVPTLRAASLRTPSLPWTRACVAPPAGGNAPAEAEAVAADVLEEPAADAAQAPAIEVPEEVVEEVPVAAETQAAVEVPEEEPAAVEPEAASAPAAAAAPAEDEGEAGDKKRNRRRRKRREVTLPLEKMTVGMELEGTVRSVTTYGAFIGDMGTPTDGLLHVSQLANTFVQNVTDVVQVGQKVKVRVTDINMEKGNFSLSMRPPAGEGEGAGEQQRKQSRREATRAKWDAFKHDPSAFVAARVTTIADFGAFCQLLTADGEPNTAVPTEGLVHISELSEQRVNNVSDVLNVGQEVKVRVVDVDRKRSRISLSMKEEGAGGDREAAAGALAEDIKKSNDAQPRFKTAFELAFEKAGVKAEAFSDA